MLNCSANQIEFLNNIDIDPTRYSESQTVKKLHQKIMSAFETLQRKSTENLLLKKTNDDLKLQINTISDLFEKKIEESRCYIKENARLTSKQEEQSSKSNNSQNYSESESDSFFVIENNQKGDPLQNSLLSSQEEQPVAERIGRIQSKPRLATKFKGENCEISNCISFPKSQICQNQSSLLETLIRQNVAILERMRNLEIKFNNGSCAPQIVQHNSGKRQIRLKGNLRDQKDDVEKTKVQEEDGQSTNITSIGKIWEVSSKNLSFGQNSSTRQGLKTNSYFKKKQSMDNKSYGSSRNTKNFTSITQNC